MSTAVANPGVSSPPALPTRSEALSHRYGVGHSELTIDQAIEIVTKATFESCPDRATFWGRDGSSILDPETGVRKPLNEVVAERFIREANVDLGYEAWRDGGVSGRTPIYHTMHTLPEGRALWRLIQPGADRPCHVNIGDEVLRNDTFATSEHLVERLASAYARQATGVVTVAVNDVEPDAFFRRIERDLLLNERVSGVRVIDFTGAPIGLCSMGGDSEECLRTSTFSRPGIQLQQRMFSSPQQWSEWQSTQWFNASMLRLLRHYEPSTIVAPRVGGIEVEPQAESVDYCRARLICEVQSVVQRVRGQMERGQKQSISTFGDYARVLQSARIFGCFPEILTPLSDPTAIDTIAKFVLRDTMPCIQQRDVLLEKFWRDPSACSAFVTEEVAALGVRVAELSKAIRG